ncbi:MAG: polysaccharide biosynthesis tyrosine autokinase [Candidatus Cloacimonadota bacterium]|nr:MAG: polysaccharide biosynthesis tyrosine autokinase [Candidatus Cloacimonadota bacterium]
MNQNNYTKEEKDTHIDILAYLKVLWRRKLVISTAIGATLIFTIIYTLLSPQIYEATTSILIQQAPEGKDSFLSPWEYTGERDNFIQNQSHILKSRTNLKLVVDKIKEQHSDKDLPIFKNPSPIVFLAYNIIVKPVERTDIIRILVHSTSPQEAAIIANAVADNLLEQSRLTARSAVSEVRRFLEEQLKIVEDNLKKSADSLRIFKEKKQVFSLSNEGQALFAKLSTFDKQYNEVNTEFLTKKKRLDFLKDKYRQNKNDLLRDITETKSPIIISLREKLIKRETEYSNYLLQGLDDEHPRIKKIKTLIEDTKQRLQSEVKKLIASDAEKGDLLAMNQKIMEELSELEVEIVVLETKKTVIGKIRSSYESQFSTLPSKELRLAQLERAYKINDNIYEMLMEKYEEAKITEAGQLGNVKIIDTAFIPSTPIRPNKKKNILFALLVGIGIGLVFTVFTEYLDTSIKEPKDIQEFIGEPTLGIIPNINHRELISRYGDNGKVADIRQLLLTHYAPHSTISEAYRSLRTNLQYFNHDKPLKNLLVTSTIAKEGKSTIVSNLGITMSQRGLKTVLIDADLRKPVLHKFFQLKIEPGLTDLIIKSEMTLDKVIRKTNIENLFVITSGGIPPNPTDLLESKKMEAIVIELRKSFDFIIFDSPPIMIVADAVVLSRNIDGVLLIVEAKKTRRDAIREAKTVIEHVGGRVLGAVLNKARFSRLDHLYGSYSGYYYYYGYEKEGKSRKTRKSKKGGTA